MKVFSKFCLVPFVRSPKSMIDIDIFLDSSFTKLVALGFKDFKTLAINLFSPMKFQTDHITFRK